MSTKVVINTCYGGFGLSEEAASFLGLEVTEHTYDWIDPETHKQHVQKYVSDSHFSDNRSDPKLIECVEKLGDKANGPHASLKIVDVKEAHYHVTEYDGLESIVASESPIVYYY